jgi:hypothetical protein
LDYRENSSPDHGEISSSKNPAVNFQDNSLALSGTPPHFQDGSPQESTMTPAFCSAALPALTAALLACCWLMLVESRLHMRAIGTQPRPA